MQFWKQVLSVLQDQKKLYLITVISNLGSSPGRKGFKMLVSEDGFIYGSVGGGVMEHTLVEEARGLLAQRDYRILLKKQIHRDHKKHGSGMICSGEQTVVFHPLDKRDNDTVTEIINSLNTNSRGTLKLSPDAILFSQELNDRKFICDIKSPTDWTYKEQIAFKSTLYIVGGGHVSVAVSGLFVTLGFQVKVFDDRENLNTLKRNTSAHQKSVIDFNNIADYIPSGPQHYVAIMTNRYIDDKLVLSKLLRKEYAYLGVLGSIAKLKTMWDALQEEGFSLSELDHVYGPIGLPIKSQTPEEIAVSIAAEVIKLRNKRK